MTIYETNYQNILRIVPNILDPKFEAGKLEAEGFMALHVDVLYRDSEGIRIAFAHNYKHPSGDIIPDPDMEIMLYPDRKMAEALTYQDSFGYQEVYPEPGKVNPKLKQSLNGFLKQWLKNILSQGHR